MIARLKVLELANSLLFIGDKRALFEKIKTLHNRCAGNKEKNSVVYGKTYNERVND